MKKADSFGEGVITGIKKAVKDTQKSPVVLSAFVAGTGLVCYQVAKKFSERVQDSREDSTHLGL